MDCDALRDDQWERIKGLVPGACTNNRRFLDALLWMARSGRRWRDLPERFGDYRSVKRRYYRWIEMGVLDEMLMVLAREADLEWLMIDATIARAHQHAAGAPVKRRAHSQGVGRSRGGLSTKIHAAGDALGLPVRLIASRGSATTSPMRMTASTASRHNAQLPTKAMTPIISSTRLLRGRPQSSFHQSETGKISVLTTPISTRSATSSSASSASSNRSAGFVATAGHNSRAIDLASFVEVRPVMGPPCRSK
jgi:transposase